MAVKKVMIGPIVITVRLIKMASLGTSTFIYRQLMKPMAIEMSAS